MKLHADIAHPINAQCRRKIQEQVISAFKEEVEKSKQPGYMPVEMDEPDDDVPEIIS
jgi:stage V sporulation protein G